MPGAGYLPKAERRGSAESPAVPLRMTEGEVMGGRLARGGLALVALASAACMASGGSGVSPRSGPDAVIDFEGPVRAVAGYGQVTGSVRAVVSSGTTALFINLRGAAPGAVHAWRLHRGPCGSDGELLADTGAVLPTLAPGEDGTVRLTTTLAATLQRGAAYHVTVHLSPERPDVVIACAELSS
jgi:hypothetical protein